jgi:hypothetical protein
MLNKEISVNKKLPIVSTLSQLLFTWCIPHLDCEGKIFGNPEQIKGVVVPYLKKFTVKRIESCLIELHDAELILLYGINCKYIYFKGFETNQRIDKDRESASIIPSPTPDLLQSESGLTPHEVKLSKVKLSQLFDFELLWKKYPRPRGKKDAIKHFVTSVKTEEDWKNINIALDNYLQTENVKKGIEQYIQNGSTWFNNWQDWVVVGNTKIEKPSAMSIAKEQGIIK